MDSNDRLETAGPSQDDGPTDSGETVIGAPNRSDLDAQIDELGYQIQELKQRLAILRSRRPREVVRNYTFRDWQGGAVPLSELFGDRTDLILVHNMGRSCNYCTLWADGFVGVLPHLQSRAAFVVTSPDPPEVQEPFARSRGWTFPMYSAHGSSFVEDMGFTDTDGDPTPGVSAFEKRPDGRIFRVQRADFGPGDDFCPAWHFFDLLAGGVGGWEPSQSY